MPEKTTFLQRIAEAFEASAKQFAKENQTLADLASARSAKTLKPRHEIADKVWLDFKPDSGVEASLATDKKTGELRFEVTERGESPWASFSYELSIETLRDARFLGILINARSSNMAAFRPCLRYVLPEGFEDQFARDMILLGDTDEDHLCFIRVDSDLVSRANTAEVLFFFEGKRFEVILNSVENLKI